MNDHTALLHAANLRVCWTDGDNADIALHVFHITNLIDAQDIILALLVSSEKPVGKLREMLEREVGLPDGG